MTDNICNKIIDGLIVDDDGELVLDDSYRDHLDECALCREIYERIEATRTLEVPDYIPAVMKRIGDIEAERASVGWRDYIRDLFSISIFRPHVLIPVAATAAIIIVILGFSNLLFPTRDEVDMTIANITYDNIATVGNIDNQREAEINEEINKQIQLNLAAVLDTDDSV